MSEDGLWGAETGQQIDISSAEGWTKFAALPSNEPPSQLKDNKIQRGERHSRLRIGDAAVPQC